MSQFKFDKEKMPAEIDALREKLMKEYEEGEKPEKKRILLTGCPSSGAPMKVVKAIEEHGGNVVVYENCGGAKSVDRLASMKMRTSTKQLQKDILQSDVPL